MFEWIINIFLTLYTVSCRKANISFTSLETLFNHKLKDILGINIPCSMLHNTACIFNVSRGEAT